MPLTLVFPGRYAALDAFLKAYIHGHYRLNRKTGTRVWVDSYQDKRPERGRTEFAHWLHRVGHFEDHMAHGRLREAMHAFHDLGHADSHKLAVQLGVAHPDQAGDSKAALLSGIHDAIKARGKALSDQVAGQVKADWERRKAAGTAGKKPAKRGKPDGAKAVTLPDGYSLHSHGTTKEALNNANYHDAKRKGLGEYTAVVIGPDFNNARGYGADLQTATDDAVTTLRGKPAGAEAAKPAPETPAAAEPAGPQEGDRNADGLVFRGGRWHRDEESDAAATGYTESATTPPKDPYEHIETRPGTTEKQRETGARGLAALARRIARLSARGGESGGLLGTRLYDGFVATGENALVGQKISSTQDLAALAQVYRDPRFETYRAIFVDGDGNVVGESAYTSRMPGAVAVGVTNKHVASVANDQALFGAAGFYLVHNHPGGRAIPSVADTKHTAAMAKRLPGLIGHVVVDHNEYSEINRDGVYRVFNAPQLSGVDYHATPSVEHPLLGASIGDPEEAAIVAKRLQAAAKKSPVMVMCKGSQATVDTILSVPIGAMIDRKARGRFTATLREIGRKTGAASNRFVVVSQANFSESAHELSRLIRSGIVTDVVNADTGASMRGMNMVSPEGNYDLFNPQRDARKSPGPREGEKNKLGMVFDGGRWTAEKAQLRYVPSSQIYSPHQGTLAVAAKNKKEAKARIKTLKEQIKAAPVGGNGNRLRVELLQAQDALSKILDMESGARRGIEARANELGLTTIKPMSKSMVLFLKSRPKKRRKVVEDTDDMIREHAHLVRVLRSPDHGDDLDEAERQDRELAEYRRLAKGGPRVLFFAKAGPLANRGGLALQTLTDRLGHVTKRWKRTGQPAPAARKPGAPPPAEAPEPVAHVAQPAAPMFHPEEMQLPTKANQDAHAEGAVYAHAEQALQQFRHWLDEGHGIADDLGYQTFDDYNAAMGFVDSGEPGGMLMLAPLKGRKRAAEKVDADYEGDWSQLLDVVRGSLVVDTMDELHRVMAKLRQSGLTLAKAPKDRFAEPTDVGYRDILMNIKAPNGHICELQLHVKPILSAKEKAAHHYYEAMRSIEGHVAKRTGAKMEKMKTDEKRALMTPEEKTAYNEAFEASQMIYNKAWEKANQKEQTR